jgi:PAS domain S-box-containing protein/diguanylate cyclase (GGDEF)-like protein
MSSPVCSEVVPPRFAEALAALPDAALELDDLGVVVAANRPAAELFGCPSEDLVGSPLERLVPVCGSAHEPARERVEARRANGVPFLVEIAVRRRSGASLCVLRELGDDALASEAQRRFDVAFDHAPIGMALFNCDGEYIRVNDALCRLLGRSRAELIGRRDQELTHPDDRQADVDVAWEILAGRYDTHQCEKRFVRPDGSTVWVLANLTFLRDEAGRPLTWVGQFQDITARRAAEDALRESEERFRHAFAYAPIGMALVSPDGRWLRVNRALCEMVGYAEPELLAVRFQDITHTDDLEDDVELLQRMLAGELRRHETEKRYVKRDGAVVWVQLSVSLVRDGDGAPQYFVSQIQDIAARKREHGELERLARHDALTGALNRRAWDEELAEAVAEAGRTGESLAIALLDLNDFKQVNDTAGHATGDLVLQRTVDVWGTRLRDGDDLARLGGDEFAVLLRGSGAFAAQSIAERLRSRLPHAPGCAIGVATWQPDDDAGSLTRRADRALYVDKAHAADRHAGARRRLHGSAAH